MGIFDRVVARRFSSRAKESSKECELKTSALHQIFVSTGHDKSIYQPSEQVKSLESSEYMKYFAFPQRVDFVNRGVKSSLFGVIVRGIESESRNELMKMYVKHCHMPETKVPRYVHEMQEGGKYEYLHLSNVRELIHENGVKVDPRTRKLVVTRSGLNSVTLTDLFTRSLHSLQSADFNNNLINNDAIRFLANNLNKGLLELNLANNRIDGFSKDLEKLLVFKELEYLNLSANPFHYFALDRVITFLQNSKSIKTLKLDGITIDWTGYEKEFLGAIENNKTLKKLQVDLTNMSSTGKLKLAEIAASRDLEIPMLNEYIVYRRAEKIGALVKAPLASAISDFNKLMKI